MGLNPSVASERAILLRFINEGAEEAYQQADFPGALMEQVFKVNGDQTIVVPYYVGAIRAFRELNSHIVWSIDRMRPRYNQFNWGTEWRNWRLRGKQALEKSITNEGPVTVVVTEVQPGISVSITGSTLTASSVTETIQLTALSTDSTNNFVSITSITKSGITTCDIYIKDLDGDTLAVIPNHQKSSEYQCIDVSTYPWSNNDASADAHWGELLYKKKLTTLTDDNDEFPAMGYDYVLADKAMQLWAQEQGKTDEAIAWDAKATRSMAQIKQDQYGATQDEVAFVAHPHDTLLGKIRQGRLNVSGTYRRI